MGDRGSGGSTSGSRSNNFDVTYKFDIFSESTFTGAIENFSGTFNETDGNDFAFSDPNKNPDITISEESPLNLNLRAVASDNAIEYTLFSDELKALGIDELALSITDKDASTPGIQAATEYFITDKDKFITLDASLATSESTAIQYILDNNVFDYVNTIRVSGTSKNDPSQITSDTNVGSGSPFTPISPDTDPVLDGDDVLTGDNGDNTLDGGEGNNVLRGQEGNDVLTSGAGSDNLDGGNGDDDLSSGGGNDILTGGAGSDLFDCGDGNDTVDGGDGNDDIFGAGGDDLIRGGNGDDILTGGAGLDVLVGDGGADIFEIGTSGGADILRDFNYGQDLIGLSDGITFEDLIVTQGDGAAILSYQDQAIASISGGTPSQINASLFTEI